MPHKNKNEQRRHGLHTCVENLHCVGCIESLAQLLVWNGVTSEVLCGVRPPFFELQDAVLRELLLDEDDLALSLHDELAIS